MAQVRLPLWDTVSRAFFGLAMEETVVSMAWLRQCSTQRHMKGISLGLNVSWGTKLGPMFIMANLRAFQSLLHQLRYAWTRLMSRLMSRACDVYATSAKRSASVPHSPIPSGKSCFCPALALSISFSSRLPVRSVCGWGYYNKLFVIELSIKLATETSIQLFIYISSELSNKTS